MLGETVSSPAGSANPLITMTNSLSQLRILFLNLANSLRMVLGDIPVALDTAEMPPRCIAIASQAAQRRRSFSFITVRSLSNFSETIPTTDVHPCTRRITPL